MSESGACEASSKKGQHQHKHPYGQLQEDERVDWPAGVDSDNPDSSYDAILKSQGHADLVDFQSWKSVIRGKGRS